MITIIDRYIHTLWILLIDHWNALRNIKREIYLSNKVFRFHFNNKSLKIMKELLSDCLQITLSDKENIKALIKE